MIDRGAFAEVVARRSFVAVKAKAFRVPVRHGECSVRDRHKRAVGSIESAMPADGIPRCRFASNGDVGTSRLEEQL
jgi:hypothetical protein